VRAVARMWPLFMAALLAGCASGQRALTCPQGLALSAHPDAPCGGFGTRAETLQPSFQPETVLAGPKSLASAWTCPNGVELDYRSGVRITEADGSHIHNPGRGWRRIAAHSRGDGVVNINGIPAYVASPAPCALGVVSLVRGGYLINVLGNGKISAADLVAVATSLQPPSPAG
jgi:hypothetical protein